MEWYNNVKFYFRCGEICRVGIYKSVLNLCLWECVFCDLDVVSEKLDSFECICCIVGYIFNYDNFKCEEVFFKFI